MEIMAVVLLVVCIFEMVKRRETEKKIEKTADAIAQFMISGKQLHEETLEEGALANLWNEIVRVEQLFCYQQHQSETEKEQLNQFMENMAHQMKTTMTALQIRIDSAQAVATTDEEVYALVRSQECVDRMTTEIERILNSSQLAAGKVEMHLQQVNLGALIQRCIRNLTPLAEKKCVNIRKEDADALELQVDEFWLEQALENIIKNALEHTEERGEVSIKALENGNQIELLIEDDGKGIEPEELPYIFERFHRGTATKAGYGIGLSMAADIIKAHHGEICAGNRSEGGAWFLIKLPILEGTKAYEKVRKHERVL